MQNLTVVMERSLRTEAALRKKRLWAGIDAGVESASICIINDVGDVVHQQSCACDTKAVRGELAKVNKRRLEFVSIEAGSATHVARGLQHLGYPVQLFEVRQLSKFLRARRNKTDAGDAQGIAEAGRIGASIVSRVYLKSLEHQALASCLAIRRHLIRHRVAAANMLARQLEQFGGSLECKQNSTDFRPIVEKQLKTCFGGLRHDLVAQLRILADFCQQLAAYQRQVDRELKIAASGNEVCRRFMEIPGVGPICALTFFAAVGDPHRFARTTSVGSYFGLAPRIRQSGLTSRKSRISKMGNKAVRSLLVHAAGLHLRHCPRDSMLREWTLKIEERRGRAPSRVALARKLAVVMLAMWKRNSPYVCATLDRAPPEHDAQHCADSPIHLMDSIRQA